MSPYIGLDVPFITGEDDDERELMRKRKRERVK